MIRPSQGVTGCVVRNPLVWSVRITLDQSYVSEKRLEGAASGLRLPLLFLGRARGEGRIPLRPDSGESGGQELRMSPTLLSFRGSVLLGPDSLVPMAEGCWLKTGAQRNRLKRAGVASGGSCRNYHDMVAEQTSL